MGKRVILIVLGALILLIGAAAAVGGAALVIVFGPDGTASSGSNHVTSSRVALVAAIDDIKGAKGFASAVGRIQLQLRVDSSQAAFVGVGPAASVERYLAGAPIDRVTDLEVDPFDLSTQPRPGTAQPPAPGEQTFWTVSDTGSHARVNWRVADGNYHLVVMNADATPNVDVDAGASLTVPHLFGIGLGFLIAGVVILLLGVFLIVRGARQRPQAGLGAGYPQSVGM
jgi:hypothetical protein